MIKIRKHKPHYVPTLNLTSMPDLIFSVLFFFMIVTHMRKETPIVQPHLPVGTKLVKATSNYMTSNLYVGQTTRGNTVIQLDGQILPLNSLSDAAKHKIAGVSEDDASLFTINLRADKNTPMHIINEIKQELRKAGALKIRYNGTEEGLND